MCSKTYLTYKSKSVSITEIRQDVILAPCLWNGSAFVANITLPHFVPDHVPIYFASVIHFHDETDGWRKVVAIEEDVLFVSTGGPPGIQMLSPIEGSTYGGTLLVHGTTRDDIEVVRVEVIVDSLDVHVAQGTDVWSLELDTVAMGYGPHKIQVRAADGNDWSKTLTVYIKVNQPPVITKVSVEEKATYIGDLPINVTAEDDNGIAQISLAFDELWMVQANGTANWSYLLETEERMDPGLHQLVVMVTDTDGASVTHRVLFYTDRDPIPPGVEIVYPEEGAKVNRTIWVNGTATGDDLDRVEMRVDSGPWLTANGTRDWSLELTPAMMSPGVVKLFARAIWGMNISSIAIVNITFATPPGTNERPNLTNVETDWGDDGEGWLRVEGMAEDDTAVMYVEYRIDEGPWVKVNTTGNWSFDIDTRDLPVGEHLLEIRSGDGTTLSDIHTETFTVSEAIEPGDTPWLFYLALIAMVVLTIVVVTLLVTKGQR